MSNEKKTRKNSKRRSKTLRNKIYALAMIGIGVVATIVSEGDATFLLFISMLAVPMFFAKGSWLE